jgi:anti-sigma B factor antagonist
MATPQPPHGFAVDVEVDADRSTVVVRGELDLSNATELSEALASAGTGVSCVVADLRAVTFIDSSAIGALVSSGRSLAEAGSRLQIGPRSPAVTQILELTGLAAGTEAFDVLEEGT